MIRQLLPILCIFFASCQTSAKTSSIHPVILVRVMGQLTMESPESVFQTCEIRENQIEDEGAVTLMINTVKSEKMQVAFPFRAYIPSMEYYFVDKGQRELFARFSSKIEQKISSTDLIAVIDKLCGSKGKGPTKPPKGVK